MIILERSFKGQTESKSESFVWSCRCQIWWHCSSHQTCLKQLKEAVNPKFIRTQFVVRWKSDAALRLKIAEKLLKKSNIQLQNLVLPNSWQVQTWSENYCLRNWAAQFTTQLISKEAKRGCNWYTCKEQQRRNVTSQKNSFRLQNGKANFVLGIPGPTWQICQVETRKKSISDLANLRGRNSKKAN